jgi:hypothetical protein
VAECRSEGVRVGGTSTRVEDKCVFFRWLD